MFQQNLSRELLPSHPEGEEMDNVLVARILEEVLTFCSESTIWWVCSTSGSVSHKTVPLEHTTSSQPFKKTVESIVLTKY